MLDPAAVNVVVPHPLVVVVSPEEAIANVGRTNEISLLTDRGEFKAHFLPMNCRMPCSC